MNPIDDSAFRILDWVGGVIMTLLGLVWKQQHEKVNDLKKEIATQHTHIEKLFDRLEQHSKDSHDRHVELLTAIHTGLASKQDK